MAEAHSPLIKTWQQLVVVVAAAFIVPIVLIMMIASLVTGGKKGLESGDSALLARIQPIGTVELATGPPAAPAAAAAAPAGTAERTGAQVVDASCGKCHVTGERGAPKIGDRTAWIQRAKRGLDGVYASALKGHAGMPARGGMAEFSDAEVKRAVEHMLNAGAGAAVVPVAAIPAAAPAATAKADGKKVHDTACMACHATGVAGAPKTGDKGAWTARIAQGANVLHDHAIKGYQGKAGVMPAKGGNAALSDDEVRAAVDYMVGVAK